MQELHGWAVGQVGEKSPEPCPNALVGAVVSGAGRQLGKFMLLLLQTRQGG